MDRVQILQVLRNLAKSQGLYGRLLLSFQEMQAKDPEAFDEAMTELEAKKFQDELDIVLYFEC